MAGVFRTNARIIILAICLAALALAAPKLGDFLKYFPDFCYPYRNTTDVADLNGDGHLDLIVHWVCAESESTMFHGTALWINQGGGRFSVRAVEFPPYLFFATVAVDVDRDGDADLLALDPEALWLFLNQGGTQGGQNGDFKVNNPIMAPDRAWQYGSAVVGDLNGDLQPGSLARAGELFGRDCAACHGPEGRRAGPAGRNLPGLRGRPSSPAIQAMPGETRPASGTDMWNPDGPAGPANFTEPARMPAMSDAALQGKIVRGGMGTGMPEFGSLHAGEALWALAAYIRTFVLQK